ncbi:MAG: LptF/LptG family permease [Gemmatimonadaceae bacterium]
MNPQVPIPTPPLANRPPFLPASRRSSHRKRRPAFSFRGWRCSDPRGRGARHVAYPALHAARGISGANAQPFASAAAIEGARSRLAEARRQVNQNAVEVHKKFAISVACVVFVLVGAPIALRFPRGGVGLVIGVSMIVFGIYYVGLIAGETLADNGYVPPAVAMWAANVILTAVGLALFARIGREERRREAATCRS